MGKRRREQSDSSAVFVVLIVLAVLMVGVGVTAGVGFLVYKNMMADSSSSSSSPTTASTGSNSNPASGSSTTPTPAAGSGSNAGTASTPVPTPVPLPTPAPVAAATANPTAPHASGRPYSTRVNEPTVPPNQAALDSPLRAHRDQPWVRLVKAEIEKPDGRRMPLHFWNDGERIILEYESSADFETHIMTSHAKPKVILKNDKGETTEWIFRTYNMLEPKGAWLMQERSGHGPFGHHRHFGGPFGGDNTPQFTRNMEVFVVLEDSYRTTRPKRFKISNSLSIGEQRGITMARDWSDDEVALIDESVKTKTGNTPKEEREEKEALAKEEREAFGGAATGNIDRSATCGESGGGPYEFAKEGAPMLGFAYSFSGWDGHPCFSQIRPIFKDIPLRQFKERVMAKEGYAVGGVNVEASPYFSGLQVIFMRVDGKRLKPTDSYLSDWIRAPSATATTEKATYKSDGKLVVGIHGFQGAICNTMGIYYQLEPGEKGKNPRVDPHEQRMAQHHATIAKMRAEQEERMNGGKKGKTTGKGGVKEKGEIEVKWGGTWFPATILKTENQKTLIHYDGWGSNWDEWVTSDRIRKK